VPDVQDRPDKATLLDAVVQFLIAEIHPLIEDQALKFRVLIAANLARMVAAEIRSEDEDFEAEIRRLQAILPDTKAREAESLGRRSDRHAAILAFNRELCDRIREKQLSAEQLEEVWEHVKQTLREKLEVSNPRFETSAKIE
jgi:hypothetical protein